MIAKLSLKLLVYWIFHLSAPIHPHHSPHYSSLTSQSLCFKAVPPPLLCPVHHTYCISQSLRSLLLPSSIIHSIYSISPPLIPTLQLHSNAVLKIPMSSGYWLDQIEFSNLISISIIHPTQAFAFFIRHYPITASSFSLSLSLPVMWLMELYNATIKVVQLRWTSQTP